MGYAGFQLFVRASYAADDTRTPTLVALGIAAGGSLLMAALFVAGSGGRDRIGGIGLGHSLAYLAGTVALGVCVRRRLGWQLGVGPALGRSLACASLCGAAAYALGRALTGRGLATAVAVVVATGLATVAYLGLQRQLGAPELRWLRDEAGR